MLICLTREGNKKNPTYTDDFEAFVRESLVKLSEGQDRILHDVATLKGKVQLNESSLNDISARLTKINHNYEEVKGELHDANCKIEEIESTMQNQAQQIGAMHERFLSIERYSREYNLRFHNIPESPGEDCRQKIGDILTEQLKMEPKIENAHRVGPSIADKPRAIICKFVYCPERFKVLQKKRDLQNIVWRSGEKEEVKRCHERGILKWKEATFSSWAIGYRQSFVQKFIYVLIIVRLVSNYRAIREIGKCFKSPEWLITQTIQT